MTAESTDHFHARSPLSSRRTRTLGVAFALGLFVALTSAPDSQAAGAGNVTVVVEGEGVGYVTSSDEAIDCDKDGVPPHEACEEEYEGSFAELTLAAHPEGAAEFAGWSVKGAFIEERCTSPPQENQTCLVLFGGSADVTVTATFDVGTPKSPPKVEFPAPGIDPVQGITPSEATFHGRVDPEASRIDACRFEYVPASDPEGFAGISTARTACVPGPASIGEGEAFVDVEAPAAGLEPGTSYRVRLVAEKQAAVAEPVVSAEAEPFTTHPPAPQVATGVVTDRGQTSLTLNGTVDPEGVSLAECYFEYGTTVGFGQRAPCAETVGSETSDVPVHAEISGLMVGTAYHFRLAARNSEGDTGYGLDGTFATVGPGFGVESFDGAVLNRDGTTDTQAGSHPWSASTTIRFDTTENSSGRIVAAGDVKDLQVDLPPGLVGDPLATPRCSAAEFGQHVSGHAECPVSSQVGVVTLGLVSGGVRHEEDVPVYNLVPPPGEPAQFGFLYLGNTVTVNARVRTGGDYGLTTTVSDISQGNSVLDTTLTFWGVPADPSHDAERFCNASGVLSCSSPVPVKPFLTLPSSCSGPQTTTLEADSWQQPGDFRTASFLSHDTSGNPVGSNGCGRLDFSPSITVRPDTTAADSPSGLDVDLKVPQNGSPDGLAEANLKKAVVTLPQGMSVNPSAAGGLAGCSAAQIDLAGPGPARCPDASKIGAAIVETPLLDHPLPGAIYLARQGDNPFASLLAVYVVIDDPGTGVVVKLAGRVEASSAGQLTAIFDDNPQLPFEDLKLNFFGGPRAALISPPDCGAYTTQATLVPWSGTPAVSSQSSFAITSGPNGGPCRAAGFEPSLSAGTTNPVAGSYSPLVLKLSRADGTQRLGSLTVTMPKGLLGKLKGVPYCPDSALASISDAEGTGAAQLASPSCLAASRIGSVSVGVGAGPDPFYLNTGRAYLAGPYKGAPLSLAIVTPAIAGPFDLGSVVVRSALRVDPETAQITAVSDPLPTILDGIPLDLRSIEVSLDRPEFTLNPTNCEQMSFSGSASSPSGDAVALGDRFQVGSCERLAFAPELALRLRGGTKRHAFPALRATVSFPEGSSANIRNAQVTLPHSEFLEQGHIGMVCTRVQFAAKACPAASIYGHAEAVTPLLEKPLSGPVYLRSSNHKLPDLVADLDGQIEVTLDAKIDTGKGGGIRNTFQLVPDAPVSRFVLSMKGGRKGLLVNSEDLCSKHAKTRAIARFVGQNGATDAFKPHVTNSCDRGKKGARGSKAK